MSDKPDGGPAFPCDWEDYQAGMGGMTLRDHFAGQAPPMPKQWWNDSPKNQHWLEVRAAWNYAYADAMLAEREK